MFERHSRLPRFFLILLFALPFARQYSYHPARSPHFLQTIEAPITETHSPAPEFSATPDTSTQLLTATPQLDTSQTPAPTTAELPTNTAAVTEVLIDPACQSQTFIKDEVIVGLKKTISADAFKSVLNLNEVSVASTIDSIQVVIVKVPEGNVCKFVKEFQSRSEVRFAEPNYLITAEEIIPNDPGWPTQYNLIAIHAPQGWQISTGSPAITIAVIDSGVDMGHPDLSGKLVPGYDFVNNDSVPQDDNGHGTHTAGIAAASSNNAIGIAGVSWGAQIMPVKVLDAAGNGNYATLASAIIWATDHGARVINLSLGGYQPSDILLEAVQYAANRGVILVAAAGNTGSNRVLYPAAYPQVVAVAASDQNNLQAYFSNYGPEVDLTAPGVAIYSLFPGGGLGYRSGTSMAAPQVAGLAAVLAGIGNPSEMQVIAAMEDSALDLGPTGVDASFGWGLIQMDAAINKLIATPTPTLRPTVTPVILTISPTASQTNVPADPGNLPENGSNHSNLLRLTPSPTPTPIYTETASIASDLTLIPTEVSGSITQTPGLLVSPLPTLTPTLKSQVLSAVDSSVGGPGYFMPCLGLFIIIIGIFLFLYPFYYDKERSN